MLITAPHPELGKTKTYLTAAASAAATAITVASNSGFTAADYTVLGKIGEEETTINKISTVAGGTTINYVGDALVYGLAEFTPVTFVKYNQVKFYVGDWSARYYTGTVSISKGSATLTGSGTSWGSITTAYALLLNKKWYDISSVDSATQITLTEKFEDESLENESYALVLFAVQSGSTVSIAISHEETTWDDTDGLAEDYYRWEYYNATTALASNKSQIISGAELLSTSEVMEPDENSLGAIIEEVYEELEVDENRISKKSIIHKANDAIKNLINTIISTIQEDYLGSYKTINLVANTDEYPLPDDFKKHVAIWVAYSGDDYRKATPMTIADDMPETDYSTSDPQYYFRDNMLGIKPIATANNTSGIKLWYERQVPSLKKETDILPQILWDYKRTIIDYILYGCYLRPGLLDLNRSREYQNDFKEGKENMTTELKDRDLSTNKTVDIINDIDLYEII